MKIRISSKAALGLDINVAEGWHHIGEFPAIEGLELDVNDVVALREIEKKIDEEKVESPEKVIPEPIVIAPAPPSRATRLKVKIAKMLRSLAALPSLPIPLAMLVVSCVAFVVAYLLNRILPVRPLRTITHEIFMSQLALCMAIEQAISGD